MGLYRKLPVVVEAKRYTGSKVSFNEIWDWMGGFEGPNGGYSGTEEDPKEFDVKTMEGSITASPGDWIIKGTSGEFYPCKPHIFPNIYEPVETEDED